MSEQETPQAEPVKSKAELFAENPNRFEDLKGCLIVVKRDPSNKRLMVLNQCTTDEEAIIVGKYVERALNIFCTQLAMREAQGRTPAGIVKPNGNMLNALRNGLRQ